MTLAGALVCGWLAVPGAGTLVLGWLAVPGAGTLVLGWFAAGRVGVATPVARFCAAAGATAIPASAVNTSNELERSFIGPTNLFISNDNPASSQFHTSRIDSSPDAPTTQSLQFSTMLILANQSLSAAG